MEELFGTALLRNPESRRNNFPISAWYGSRSSAARSVIRAGILCGALNVGHRRSLANALNALAQLPLTEQIWGKVGDNLAALRARGITVPFPDAVIATLGIENDIEVWARDPYFPTMQKTLPGLKLFQEPP